MKQTKQERILCMSCKTPLGMVTWDRSDRDFTFGAWCDDGCMEVWIAKQEAKENR